MSDPIMEALKEKLTKLQADKLKEIGNLVKIMEADGIKSVRFSRDVINRRFHDLAYEATNTLSIAAYGSTQISLYEDNNRLPHLYYDNTYINGAASGLEDVMKGYYNRIVEVVENSMGMSIGDLTEGWMGYI
jgi:hypothetical protein